MWKDEGCEYNCLLKWFEGVAYEHVIVACFKGVRSGDSKDLNFEL